MYCLSKTPEVEPDFFKWSQDEKINFKNSKKILKNSKIISKIMFLVRPVNGGGYSAVQITT